MFDRYEVESVYVAETDRYVVALVVGYGNDVVSPQQAVAAAIELVTEPGCWDTQWSVYDRKTGKMTLLEQSDVAGIEVP